MDGVEESAQLVTAVKLCPSSVCVSVHEDWQEEINLHHTHTPHTPIPTTVLEMMNVGVMVVLTSRDSAFAKTQFPLS